MSKNRVIITLLAIFLIAGIVSLAAANNDAAAGNNDAAAGKVADNPSVQHIDIKAGLVGPSSGVKSADPSIQTYRSWNGYAQIGTTYSYVSGTTGYNYVYVSKVYGTTDTGYNGYYRVYPSTSISANTCASDMYRSAVDCMLNNHWVYIYINSNGYVYDIDVTPYTYGTL